MAEFEVSESFLVPMRKASSGARLIDTAAVKELAAIEPLLLAKGVYVFSVRAGRGCKPWYVGKSEKMDFLREAFNPRNVNNLNNLMNDRKGTLEVTFVTQVASRGKPNLSQIGEIELTLIGQASERNHELLNVQGALGRKWTIRGIYGAGRGRTSATQLAFIDLLGIW